MELQLNVLMELIAVAVIGGLVFSVAINSIFPFFGIPKVGIKTTVYALTAIAFLFWSSFVLPTAIVVVSQGADIWVSIMRSVAFAVFMLTIAVVTVIIGEASGPD